MDMVINVTFNNISVISWQSVLLVEERGVPTEKYLLQNQIHSVNESDSLPGRRRRRRRGKTCRKSLTIHLIH